VAAKGDGDVFESEIKFQLFHATAMAKTYR